MKSNESTINSIRQLSDQDHNYSYKLIAMYLLDNLAAIGNVKIKDIAHDTFTSNSSILRFYKKLGFNGFKEMIYAIEYENNNLQNFNFVDKEMMPAGENSAYCDRIKSSLDKTCSINAESIVKCKQAIQNHRSSTFIFGIGLNQKACYYLSVLLTTLNYTVNFCEDIEEQKWNSLNKVDHNSLCIFISFSFSDPNLFFMLKNSEQKAATIIVISKNRKMTAHNLIFLEMGINESTIDGKHNSLMSTLFIINLIISSIL